MNCPNCGKETYEDALFCTGCGARLNIIDAPSVESADTYDVDAAKAESPEQECAEFVCADEAENAAYAQAASDTIDTEPGYAPERGDSNATAPMHEKPHSYAAAQNAAAAQPIAAAAASRPKQVPQDSSPLSTWGFFWREFLSLIPFINIIVLFILAFANGINVNSRSFARSRLIYMLILALLIIAAAIVVIIYIKPIAELINRWLRI